MPIDFPDLLRSTLLSGKLILSKAIKASPGKKVVQDVRDTTNQVEIDLEDDTGTISTATIPKGAAVDATAREAAAEAQADIDDHEANHPEGGGGGETTPLSDATPESTGDADAGVSTDASRGDHAHNVPNATTTLRGISEKATGGEATTGTNNEAHMTPLRVSQVFADRAGDADPLSPAAPTVGTSTNFSREDHGHGVEQRVLNQDPNASADTLGKFQVDPQGNAYTTTPDTEHGTAQTADFARFTHADYIGELSGEPNPLAQTLGTYYFLIVDHKLQVTANNSFGQLRWEDAAWSDLLVPGAGYRGVRANDAAAIPHIQMNGDVFFDRHSDHIRVASNFVAGVTEHTGYESKRLARIEEVPELDPLFVERSTLPAVTDDSPDLVYLSHGHSVGGRADAIIDVGFSPSGVAGYSSGEISGILGSINTPSPLAEVFGLGSAADYLLESVYWLNRADLEEFVAVWLNNVRYLLGDISVVPGGGAFLVRIMDYPTGLATAEVNINFERLDESYYFNDGATEVIENGLYQKTDNGQGETIYDRVPTESVRHRDQIGPPLVAPNKGGLLDTDDLGRIWSAAGQVFRVLTPPDRRF